MTGPDLFGNDAKIEPVLSDEAQAALQTSLDNAPEYGSATRVYRIDDGARHYYAGVGVLEMLRAHLLMQGDLNQVMEWLTELTITVLEPDVNVRVAYDMGETLTDDDGGEGLTISREEQENVFPIPHVRPHVEGPAWAWALRFDRRRAMTQAERAARGLKRIDRGLEDGAEMICTSEV